MTLLNTIPELHACEATCLVRAARLYQDAVWIIESAPEISWLMLVSALETAALQWRAEKEPPVDRLSHEQPELVELLKTYGGADLLGRVADHIADSLGVTKKFTDFVMTFLPDPPPLRPVEWAQQAWGRESMEKSLKTIYRWRSKALHTGVPFPLPMCQSPLRVEGGLAEKPVGLSTGGRGGVWVQKDTPMCLHTFEYTARNVLLRWWRSMLPS